MRWVKETLPPLEVRRKLLITVRWSMTSFIGTDRTDVAVGTVSDDSMFFAVRMGAPRSAVYFGWAISQAPPWRRPEARPVPPPPASTPEPL